jgi:hypothetical protein
MAGDVDSLELVAVERLADGGVVDAGVMRCHVRAGVFYMRVIQRQ